MKVKREVERTVGRTLKKLEKLHFTVSLRGKKGQVE